MKKTILFALFYLFSVVSSFAQRSVHIAGGEIKNTTGSISYSVGQVNYINTRDNKNTLTQGVQQPYEISIISDVDNLNKQFNISLFPNPTLNTITVTINETDASDFKSQLFDINGKLLLQKESMESKSDMDMTTMAAGTYFLKIENKYHSTNSFKIIKN
jgi:Secretion system C-terminal sorting domain